MGDESTTTIFRNGSLPVWPLPRLDGRAPAVVSGTGAEQAGIDLAYARPAPVDLAETYPPGSVNGTDRYFMPDFVPALCVFDGVIAYAREVAHGYAMVIDHGNGWMTHYANLEHMFARPTDAHLYWKREHVKSGDVLGFVGALQPGGFKCLHFELWHRDDDGHLANVDPASVMSEWLLVPAMGDCHTAARTAAVAA